MVERQKRSESEARKSENAFEHIDDPILRKLRYPDKGVHRVKYEDDVLIVSSEEKSG